MRKITLSEEQQLALDNFKKFMGDSSANFFVLTGYAGTGKTFVTSLMLDTLLEANETLKLFKSYGNLKRIIPIVTSTTHKAVENLDLTLKNNAHISKRLENFSNTQSLNTIYKTFKLSLNEIKAIDQNSKIINSLVHKRINWARDKVGRNYKTDIYLFVDEAGYLSKNMHEFIKTNVELLSQPNINRGKINLKVVYILDPYQINCISDESFDYEKISYKNELTEILRQSNKAENAFIYSIVDHIKQDKKFSEKELTLYFPTIEKYKVREEAQKILKNSTFTFLCWRNKTERAINRNLFKKLINEKELLDNWEGSMIVNPIPLNLHTSTRNDAILPLPIFSSSVDYAPVEKFLKWLGIPFHAFCTFKAKSNKIKSFERQTNLVNHSFSEDYKDRCKVVERRFYYKALKEITTVSKKEFMDVVIRDIEEDYSYTTNRHVGRTKGIVKHPSAPLANFLWDIRELEFYPMYNEHSKNLTSRLLVLANYTKVNTLTRALDNLWKNLEEVESSMSEYFYALLLLLTHNLFGYIKSPFVSTVHSAQGSTYPNTFIHLKDIQMIRDVDTYNRLLYVACTRHKDKIYIVE